MAREMYYQVIERNAMMTPSARAIGGPVALADARRLAAERMPRPETYRAAVSIVARPMSGGPDVELARGTAR